MGFAIAIGAEFHYIKRAMANISKLKMIQIKRRMISQKITQQREVLAALEAEERDLEIAERVLANLEAEQPEPELALEPESASTPASESSGKPEGIPTMPEMIFEALKDARSRGVKGLEPKDITAFIAEKWWPDVKINNVGPIAWRLYKSERLAKRQSKYRLPDEWVEANAAA
ncbi:hypothetical protein I6F34_00815 [Bradyrhizobium sp. BRP05]|nr:hypothetical protein [Bradyrhizobium sp. BRP05]